MEDKPDSTELPENVEANEEAVSPLVKSLVEPEHEALTTEEVRKLSELDDVDLGRLIESLPQEARAEVLAEIPPERYWPLLVRLQHETVTNLFKLIPSEVQDSIMEYASDADIIELADALPKKFVGALLVEVESERAEALLAALSYDEEQVGRYMKTDVMRVRGSSSVNLLRKRLDRRSSFPAAIVVLDENNHAAGVMLYRDITRAGAKEKLIDLLSPVTCFRDDMTLAEAARAGDYNYNTAWYPVEREGEVVGVLGAADLLDYLKEKNIESLGSEASSEEEDLFTPVMKAARIRAIWLVINLGTAFLASAVIAMFEGTLEKVVALAVLMPVVASMGGIAGSQTLAIAIRGLALKTLSEANLKLLLVKEARIAVLNGIVLGLLVGVVVWQWFDSPQLGAIIAVAILVNGLAAAYAGTMVPFLLKKLKIDPAVSGSVILTTVTDVVGFFLFLGLGTLVFVTLAATSA
ncbi:MAG: magnesium transporter [Halieaceae bacterium]|jgi:Mg2+ transporter MgtE|nr:magnesium transporter [Halieaceae bacterium]